MLLRKIFTTEFVPHGYCMRWQSDVVQLHAISDAVIALAYFSIPVLLLMFVRKRRDIRFPWLFGGFAMFIMACGSTHIMDIVTLWTPLYRLAGILKAATALVSLGTAVALIRIWPKLLRIPTTEQLEAANDALALEVRQRQATEIALARANEELRIQANENLERFRQTFEHAAIGLAHLSPDRRFVLVNEHLCRLVGYSREDLMTMGVGDITHPADMDEDRSLANALLAGELQTYSMEKRYVHQDGRPVWVALNVSLVRDSTGRPDYFISAIKDIGKEKDAESRLQQAAALARSEERFRCLIEGVKDYAILMLDASGRVDSWNAGAERITGYTSEEIVGKHFSAFYTEESLACGGPERELAIATETGPFEEEGWRVTKHGSRFWAEVVVTALWHQDGSLRGFSKVTRDITERKRAEELVKEGGRQLTAANLELALQSQRANEANHAKSDFLATMSHEVRTPMNAILGMADLLWETELDSTQRQYVGVFRRAGANLLTLVNDILDLSKIESGHFELEQIDFDLEDLVERTIEMIRPKTQAKRIALIVDIDPGIPALVGDPTRLRQVLTNLLGNAVKFTEQGEIVLRIVRGGPEPARIRVSISDTGIGIPLEKLDSVFDDFTQAEASITRRFGGTGLGLGICRRLVTRMGGELRVESEAGKGSCFSFDAVFAEGNQREWPAAEETTISGSITGRRVLIVDNNATNRLIFAEMCHTWGMKVSECSRSEEVLATLRSADKANDRFDVMILDRLLPGTDGFELVPQIYGIQRTLPIIMATSDKVPGDETRSKNLGLAGYTLKPVRRSELLRMLCSAMGTTKDVIAEGGAAEALPKPGGRKRILIAEDSEDNRFLLQAYLKNTRYDATFVENGQLAVERECGPRDSILF